MDSLLSLIKKIDKLPKAPATPQAQYPSVSAPYQPVLLAIVLKKIQAKAGRFADNQIYYADCREPYIRFYQSLFGKQSEDFDWDTIIVQPFWVLGPTGSRPIWNIKPPANRAAEFEQEVLNKVQIKTKGKFEKLVEYAYFDEATWEVVKDSDAQNVLIDRIIDKHLTVSVRECLESATKD
jgi:predicted restriction endonuclease